MYTIYTCWYFSTNNTNLMLYHPHGGAPYPPDLILHEEHRYQLNPNLLFAMG